MANKQDDLITPEAFASFPSLFELDDNGKYSINLLFTEDSDIQKLRDAVEVAIVAEYGAKRPKKLELPFKDQGDREYEGYKPGCVYITAQANKDFRPVVKKKVEGALVTVTNPSEIYAGAKVKASLRIYAWKYHNEKGVLMKEGISFGLCNVFKVADAPRFGGGGSSGGTEFGNENDSAVSEDGQF